MSNRMIPFAVINPEANPESLEAKQPAIDNGAEVYADNCSACHGTNGEGAGSNPSLIEAVPNLSDEELMNVLTNPPGIMAIVDLTTPEADAVFSYSREQFGEYGGAR